jgi:Xaa-Pro dipeptidase
VSSWEFGAETFQRRREKVQELMRRQGVDIFAVCPSANLYYLSGYSYPADERLLLLILPADSPPFLFVNCLYQTPALALESAVYWTDGEDPLGLLKKALAVRDLSCRTIALEGAMPALFTLPLSRLFPESRFVLGDSLTMPLRQCKEAQELDRIRWACRAADQALEELIAQGRYWLGKTEEDFSEALGRRLRKAGLDRYGSVVAAGDHGAAPHHTPGSRVIREGQGLLIDFWGAYGGYYTDCTRTFHVGKPSAEFERVHRIVLEAHLAAEAAARPGCTLGDVDAAARQHIERSGYGAYFTHRTGHGLGLDAHEGVSAAPGEETPIEAGMVFSIEPGIYLPGKFGVRIENLIAPRQGGAEVLHQYPRELILL